MAPAKLAPCGSWVSPITSDLIVSEVIGLSQPLWDGPDLYWLEMRPTEGGRYVIVRRTPDGATSDLTPPPFNARTRVHEYGGGPYIVCDGVAYFTNFSDQRLYRVRPGESPAPLTPEAPLRYADFAFDRPRNRLLCVLEDHGAGDRQAVNSIAAVSLVDGRSAVLVSGNDFYSSPRQSPDGSRLAWITWNHPNMPWDGTELWTAPFRPDGSLAPAQKIAGGPEESVQQPLWSPDGTLYFVSDRTGWWNLHRLRDGRVEPLHPMSAEFARPAWVFANHPYAFLDDSIICSYAHEGAWRLARLTGPGGTLRPIDNPYTDLSYLQTGPGVVVMLAGSPTDSPAVVVMDPMTTRFDVIRRTSSVEVDPDYLSVPEPVEFPTENGLTAYALFYPPKNPAFQPAPGERPPLLVHSHGGPTSAAGSTLSLSTQFWTSRGIAVLDVNYGGSTGYGRAYRKRLEDNWGIVDVDDCTNGALFLARAGKVDRARMAIAGGSAGGYTTLCALTFKDVFKAGASYFGVSDLEAFACETHKFESRYLDRLIGPYPERRDLYQARSPIHFIDRLSCPVIFFQGLEDKIVLPNQAQMMADALRRKGLPVALLMFDHEQHGFRQAANIKRSLDAELFFYGRVFGFVPADPIEPVQIDNL